MSMGAPSWDGHWHLRIGGAKAPPTRRVFRLRIHSFGLFFCTRINRQSEIESGAWPRIRSEPQTAAMRFNDGTADRQAHAGTLLLGSEERVEDVLRLFRFYSLTGISD